MDKTFDYEQFKARAIEQLKSGVPLSGKNGVLAPLLENLPNSALEVARLPLDSFQTLWREVCPDYASRADENIRHRIDF